MNARMQLGRRLTATGALLAGALLVAAAAPAWAQDVQPDPRWQAWLGCWVPVGESAPEEAVETRRVCVIPAPASAVEVVALSDWRIVAHDRIEATGERRPATRGGCSGWESAEWSAEGRRVYLRSEYLCPGGLTRSSTGLMAMSSGGDWLDVQSVAAADSTAGVRVIRYHEAVVASALPGEIRSALQDLGPAAGMARVAASAPLTTADVMEVSRHVGAAVVEAWLAEQGQGFALDARRLVELADAGVPNRVIDLMIALSSPKAFTVNSATREVGRRVPEEWDPYGLTPYGRDRYAPYGWSYYDYSPYGFADGYGWYRGDRAVFVAARRAGGGQTADHGRVVNGAGYVRGDAGSGANVGRVAAPSPSVSSPAPSAQRSAGSASGSGTGSGSGRTAHRRP